MLVEIGQDGQTLLAGMLAQSQVHGGLLHELTAHTFLAFCIWLVVIIPVSLGRIDSRMIRRTVGVAGIIWLLGAILLFSDPGNFLEHWFVD